MKHIICKQIYTVAELKKLVIEKLRVLGFEDVSEQSLNKNETHHALYQDAIEAQLMVIKELEDEYEKLLAVVKKAKLTS